MPAQGCNGDRQVSRGNPRGDREIPHGHPRGDREIPHGHAGGDREISHGRRLGTRAMTARYLAATPGVTVRYLAVTPGVAASYLTVTVAALGRHPQQLQRPEGYLVYVSLGYPFGSAAACVKQRVRGETTARYLTVNMGVQQGFSGGGCRHSQPNPFFSAGRGVQLTGG